MHTELVSIPTDTVPLDGAYYTPEGCAPVGGILLMHGNTMNFYIGAPRFLPPYLTALGYACLAFNRRGHDILTIRDSREPVGGAFQTAAEGIADNEYAARFFAERGHTRPIVIGHSNGGMLAAEFAAHHPEIRALVLLSAHCGGAEILRLTCEAGQLAADDLEDALARARERVSMGDGRHLMVLPGWWYVISAESLLDRLSSTPDTLTAAERIRCPALYLRGEYESPHIYPAEEFQRRTHTPCDVVVVPGCDHFYVGKEPEIARIVCEWLTHALSGDA